MSTMPAFLILFLASLAHASLQLDLGGFILLYHASRTHQVKKQTRILATSYILGSIFMILVCISAGVFFISTFSEGTLPDNILTIIVGILLAIAIVICFFYNKIGPRGEKTTELWISRRFSHFIDSRAHATSSRIEAFSLGMLTIFAELPFSILLIILSADSLSVLSPLLSVIGFLMYLIIAIFPLVLCRIILRSGRTVVDIQKFRVKSRDFLRIMSGTFFAILAIFILVFRLLGEL